ncbi:MAG: GAF domain-containing protein [Planctomycetes bacterium]|nr:GAF domain-containing protein [Planctomycetota bacterium]
MIELLCKSCQAPVRAATVDDLPALRCTNCSLAFGFPAQRNDQATLLCIAGDFEGSEFPIADEVSFGRAPGNTVKLRELKVSRRHAAVRREGNQFFVEDMQSGNGTYVNDRLVSRQELRHGDLVKIATTVFAVRLPGGRARDTQRDSQLVIGEKSIFEQTKFELEYKSHQTLLAPTVRGGTKEVEALAKANDKLRIIYEVTNKISSILNLETLLQEVLRVVFEIIPADRGAILLVDEESQELQSSVVKLREDLDPSEALIISRSIVSKVVQDRKSLLTSDTQVDDRFAAVQSIISQGIRSAMSVPLICRDNLLGVLHIDSSRRSDAFNEDNLQLLTGIAGQAAIAIENAKLLARIERESQMRSDLQRYLSPALVDQVVTKKIRLDMGGTLRKVTILFSDIREFTPLSEQIPAQEVVSTMNRYFEVMVDVIFKYGGTLDKFIGDATMAVWGTPVAHPLDPLLAVRAALDMQKELFVLNCRFRSEDRRPLRMGIGVNTGEVVSGNMGSTKRMEYTVIGKEVNLAQRIETLTRANQIFISEATYNEIKDWVRVIELDPTTVKGIKGPIRVYYLLAARVDDDEGDERREHERYKFFVPAVAIHERSGETMESAVVDVSRGGLGMQLLLHPSHKIEQGDALRVRLAMEGFGDLGENRGVVVHKNSVFETDDLNLAQVGFHFTEVGEYFEYLFSGEGPLTARLQSSKA